MVSCVIGTAMKEQGLLTCIVYYGIIIYFILIPMMVWRLITVEVKPAVYHTMAVVLAPCSLCLVSYLNIISNPNRILVYLFICLCACVLIIYHNQIAKVFLLFIYARFCRYDVPNGDWNCGDE